MKLQKKSKKLFDADAISMRIAEAVRRDLSVDYHHVYNDPSTVRYFKETQSKDILKKYSPMGQDNSDELQDNAFAKFLHLNDYLARFTNFSELAGSRPDAKRPLSMILHRARTLVRQVCTDFTEDEIFDNVRHSSGSSLGVSFSDTSLDAKLSFPITVTHSAKPLLERILGRDEFLCSQVKDLNKKYPINGMFEVKEGSRATTVDKTVDKRRMIAIEPTGNMYLQQATMAMLYKRFLSVGLDVATLPMQHTQRACHSSITSKEATVDWSSASDCVTIELLRWLLPPKWFMLVDQIRCESMEINGRFVQLNMISTMGNANTFPLEMLVFWAIGTATISSSQNPSYSALVNPEFFNTRIMSVFGDDCLLPTEIASTYITVMEQFGFIVNEEKSFFDYDGFRESCGGDYLHGCDVRPFHIRAPHNNKLSSLEPWLYILMNGLQSKYESYFGTTNYIYEKRFYTVCSELFDEYKLKVRLVPSTYPDDAGLKLPDWQRLKANYAFKFHPLSYSEHGTAIFSFRRFSYRETKSFHHGIRYAEWLKRPVSQDHKLKLKRNLFGNDYTVKRKGGYVVSKGVSCHWQPIG